MTETKTVKEQLVEAKAELAKQQKELQDFTESVARLESYIFDNAKEMATLTKLTQIYDKADSIKSSKSVIKSHEKEMKKVNKEIKALEKQIAKLDKMDVDFETDVVDEFLASWRAKVEEDFREAVATKYPEAIAELEASEKYQMAKWDVQQEMRDAVNSRFGSAFMYVWQWRGDMMEERMADMLDRDVEMKKATLLGRITEITGKVTDAKLYIADDGNINGLVKGENGTAKVQTILAGGYNIQTLHYRLLVHQI